MVTRWAGMSAQERGRGRGGYHGAGVRRACSGSRGLAQTSPHLAGTARQQSLVARIPNVLWETRSQPQECPELPQCLQAQEGTRWHPKPTSINRPCDRGPWPAAPCRGSSPQSVMAVNTHQAAQPLAPALCRPAVWNEPGSDPATTSHPASKARHPAALGALRSERQRWPWSTWHLAASSHPKPGASPAAALWEPLGPRACGCKHNLQGLPSRSQGSRRTRRPSPQPSAREAWRLHS